jgi:hypothetical protein
VEGPASEGDRRALGIARLCVHELRDARAHSTNGSADGVNWRFPDKALLAASRILPAGKFFCWRPSLQLLVPVRPAGLAPVAKRRGEGRPDREGEQIQPVVVDHLHLQFVVLPKITRHAWICSASTCNAVALAVFISTSSVPSSSRKTAPSWVLQKNRGVGVFSPTLGSE